jgi:hypothetical protein
MTDLPFTADQFFGTFAEYNGRFSPVALALWIASIGLLSAAWRNPVRRSRQLVYFLGVLWLWNAVAYHVLIFTRINPAAWLFGGLFVVQAVLFARAAASRSIEFFLADGVRRVIGTMLVCFALAYPIVSIASGHPYPATPTYGVPCPTTILTIGLLLTVRGPVPGALSVVPAFWGLVGGSASVLLAVVSDYVLLGAGVLLTAKLVTRGMRVRLSSRQGGGL